MLLRNEHEVQIKALRCQHEDECEKLQKELDLQKSRVRSSLKCDKNVIFVNLTLMFYITGRQTESFIAIAVESNEWQDTGGTRSEFKKGWFMQLSIYN